MKVFSRLSTAIICLLCFFTLIVFSPPTAIAAKAVKKAEPAAATMEDKIEKPKAIFDITKMSDMSDFDPTTSATPATVKGDTIKVAYVNAFSGPAAANGPIHMMPLQFAAYDINKRGGIWVDGKKRLIEIIQADHMSKPDQCMKICERMILQEKVHVLMGTSGSNLQKIINEVANKYKVISVNEGAVADELQDATNFGRYAFMTSPTTDQIGRGMAYFYGQIRKKEKKFYILCQDYSFGHGMADSFKAGLKEYFPGAQVVGEDYHKLFVTDFAPYLEKIKASGAEVIYTGDWIPDAANLLKQARQMGVNLPFANLFMNEPNFLHEVGVEGTKGLMNIDVYDMPYAFKNYPGYIKFYKAWNNGWKKGWKAPFNTRLYEHGTGGIGLYGVSGYWLFSVIERAKSLDPEKIIKVWEGDVYQYPNGKIVKMRGCDHKTIQPLRVAEYVPPAEQKASMSIPPYYWFQGTSSNGPEWLVPASKVLPPMDQKLDRCKGKSDWGE
jgi:ABC-type branched-subunit amino acid transport system substrate-binding protein